MPQSLHLSGLTAGMAIGTAMMPNDDPCSHDRHNAKKAVFPAQLTHVSTLNPNSCNNKHTCPTPYWVLVRGFISSYHNKETTIFTIDPHYGNLNKTP